MKFVPPGWPVSVLLLMGLGLVVYVSTIAPPRQLTPIVQTVVSSADSYQPRAMVRAVAVDTPVPITHSYVVNLEITRPPMPDFSLLAGPISVTVAQGATASFRIYAPVTDGFASTVVLSSQGAIPVLKGMLPTFMPQAIPAGPAYSTMTVKVDKAQVPGTYQINVRGASLLTTTHTTTATLVVVKK